MAGKLTTDQNTMIFVGQQGGESFNHIIHHFGNLCQYADHAETSLLADIGIGTRHA